MSLIVISRMFVWALEARWTSSANILIITTTITTITAITNHHYHHHHHHHHPHPHQDVCLEP